MKNTDEVENYSENRWIPASALFVALYFMYASTFLTDYVMNDEWAHLGSHIKNLYLLILRFTIFNNRPLFGIANALVFEFVGFNLFRIQFIRFLNFLSLAGIALLLWYFLARRSRRPWFSFFVILFLFSQRSILGLQGYSLVFFAEATPAIWLNFLAFFLYFFFFERHQISSMWQMLIIFLLFLMAMLFNQTYAFLAMIPLSYLSLTEWSHYKHRIFSFFGMAIAALIFASIIFRLSVWFNPEPKFNTYPLAQQAFAALSSHPLDVLRRALNPITYWNAFELWTYPFPFHNTLPLLIKTRKTGAKIMMLLWGVLIADTIILELKEQPPAKRGETLRKWLVVAIAMGFGMMFVLLDSPTKIIDHRPHMLLPLTGVIILTGAYAVQTLSARYKIFSNFLLNALGALLVLYIAFGAQSDLERGIVATRHAQLEFIRTMLTSRPPETFDKIIIVLPQETQICLSEPCDPWFGQIVQSRWHLQRHGIYHYIFVSEGIMPGSKEIIFIDQPLTDVPPDAVVIDWNRFVAARKNLKNYLRWLQK